RGHPPGGTGRLVLYSLARVHGTDVPVGRGSGPGLLVDPVTIPVLASPTPRGIASDRGNGITADLHHDLNVRTTTGAEHYQVPYLRLGKEPSMLPAPGDLGEAGSRQRKVGVLLAPGLDEGPTGEGGTPRLEVRPVQFLDLPAVLGLVVLGASPTADLVLAAPDSLAQIESRYSPSGTWGPSESVSTRAAARTLSCTSAR